MTWHLPFKPVNSPTTRYVEQVLCKPPSAEISCFLRSRFSCRDVGADDVYEFVGRFQGLLCFVMRNESGVVIKSDIALSPEAVEDGDQARVLGVNSRPNEFDNGDVMAGLASCPKAVAEHESQCCPEHCFVSLLKARLLIKRQDLMRRGQFPVGAREEALDLRPIKLVRPEFFHVELRVKHAYGAIHFQGKHPCERGATRIPFAIRPYN